MNSIPGYQPYEYALVLRPHEELSHRIIKVREHFSDQYKTEISKWTWPQVTLASFQQLRMMEDRLVNRFRTIAMGFPPFKVEMKDFGSFPSHTIFINVTSKLPVQNLVKMIRSDCQRLMKMDAEHKPFFIMDPYITVARKLKPWQYEKGWLEYSTRHFTGRFIANSMLLLKRPAGELKYHIVEKFSFQNLPVLTKQGELFG